MIDLAPAASGAVAAITTGARQRRHRADIVGSDDLTAALRRVRRLLGYRQAICGWRIARRIAAIAPPAIAVPTVPADAAMSSAPVDTCSVRLRLRDARGYKRRRES